MDIVVYDSLLKYLNDRIIPKSVHESSSTYAVKNYRAMAEGYMLKESSIYKVRIRISITAKNSKFYSNCYKLRASVELRIFIIPFICVEREKSQRD